MLSKKFLFFFIFAIFLSFTTLFFLQNKSQVSQIHDHQKINILVAADKELEVEVVNTPESITQGLSGREEIGSDGMLFIFPKSHTPSFWMKDMKFDLDFVWISENIIVDITENVPMPEPNIRLQDLAVYSPRVEANMVLEVKSGDVEKLGVETGDRFELIY